MKLKTWNTVKVFINEKTTEMLTARERDSEVGEKGSVDRGAGEFLLAKDGQGWPSDKLLRSEGREGASHSDTWEKISLMWKEQQIQRPWIPVQDWADERQTTRKAE